MKKVLLLISLFLGTLFIQAVPTITIDGDKSDWAEVPMLTQPGTWPMLKVLPAADAEMGTNALAYMVENKDDFDNTWDKYPKAMIDKDYDKSTSPIAEYWAYKAMGIDYEATTAYKVGDDWYDCQKGISENSKVIEIGIPSAYITDLGSKFGFAMYYNSGAWYCPNYNSPEVSPSNGFLYKPRSYNTLPCKLTPEQAFTHQSMGDCSEYIDFSPRDNGNDTMRWAAFPIELKEQTTYDVAVDITTSGNGWSFELWLVNVETNAIVAHMEKVTGSSSDNNKKLGSWNLSSVPTGKYMLKIKNRTAFSKVKLYGLYLSAQVKVDIPATLTPVNAEYSTNAKINHDSIDLNREETAYAKWKIHAPNGYYVFKTNAYNAYGGTGQKYTISIFDASDESVAISTKQSSWTSAAGSYSFESDAVYLSSEKDYIVKIQNYSGSKGRVMNIEAKYAGGATVNVPGTLNCADAVLEPKKMIRDDEGIIHYKDNGTPGNEYAWWKINVTQTGTYSVTAFVELDPERVAAGRSPSDHQLFIALYSALDGEPIASSAETSVNNNTGIRSLPDLTFEGTGAYYIRLDNLKANSSALLSRIVIAPAIALSEEATDVATVIEPNDGKTVNAQLTRSFVGGMYNTICLPFAVSAAEKERVFGSAKVIGLESSSIEEGGFVLNLNFDEVDALVAGTPYLIKPTGNVANPTFFGVKIDKTPRNVTTSCANFIGNFVADHIEADENNLFLGANDMLYFPTSRIDILGMRAYFLIHDAPASAISRARIVEHGQVATEIELVGNTLPTEFSDSPVRKLIQNGQLIILRDGVEYNVMGVRVK